MKASHLEGRSFFKAMLLGSWRSQLRSVAERRCPIDTYLEQSVWEKEDLHPMSEKEMR